MSEVWYAAAVKPLTYRMPAKFRVEGWHVLLSISAEPGPGISVQSRPTLRLSSGRPRSPRREPRASRSALTSDGATREALWAPGGDPRGTGLRFGF